MALEGIQAGLTKLSLLKIKPSSGLNRRVPISCEKTNTTSKRLLQPVGMQQNTVQRYQAFGSNFSHLSLMQPVTPGQSEKPSGYTSSTPASWSNGQMLVSLHAVVSNTGHLHTEITEFSGYQPLCNTHLDQQLGRLIQAWALEQRVKFQHHSTPQLAVSLFFWCSVEIRSLWNAYVVVVQEKVSREAICCKYSAT